MPDPSIREVALTPSGGDPVRLALVSDSLLPTGKRAITTSYTAANADLPTRRRRVQWEIWGPAGASLESQAGGLGVDFSRGLDTRWERRLVPGGLQNSLDLTPFDPPGQGSYFGTAIFGSSYFGSGNGSGGSGNGPDVVTFAEQGGYLLVFRGSLLTQVDMTTTPWTVVSTTQLDANTRDAELWRGTVKVALGPNAVMQRVTGVNPTGVSLDDVTATTPAGDVYASAIKRGSDRAWYINAFEGNDPILGVPASNYAQFTLDDFVTLAAPFQVGDPEVGTTGIGPFGPFTQFGQEDQISSFTDQGKPIPQSRALQSVHSPLNGKQFADPGWEWNYYTSITGLRANKGGTDNPVGVGERMRGFTGHNGLPNAVYQVRGELPVAYETESGEVYAYRCTFGPETGGSGQPLLWSWFYDSTGECGAIFSSTTGAPSQGIWLIRADGTNLTYELIAADGRDDLYGEYEYAADGLGAVWAVQAAFDANPTNPTGATYVGIGQVVGNGQHTLIPNAGTPTDQLNPSPTENIAGTTIKPRIRLVDSDTNVYELYLTTLDRDPNLLKVLRLFRLRSRGMGDVNSPPELLGTLECEYDERPEQVEAIEIVINVTGTNYSDTQIWNWLREWNGQDTRVPMAIQLPDDLPGASGGQKYGFITDVTARRDLKGDNIEAVTVRLETWPQAEALT